LQGKKLETMRKWGLKKGQKGENDAKTNWQERKSVFTGNSKVNLDDWERKSIGGNYERGTTSGGKGNVLVNILFLKKRKKRRVVQREGTQLKVESALIMVELAREE